MTRILQKYYIKIFIYLNNYFLPGMRETGDAVERSYYDVTDARRVVRVPPQRPPPHPAPHAVPMRGVVATVAKETIT